MQPENFTADELLPITAIEPFTFQDYPGKMACILWFTGCNLRCPYCHNPDLVFGTTAARLSYGSIRDFLQSRQGQLEGVVLSGGECTLFPKITALAAFIKQLGFELKIDSNGVNTSVIQALLEAKLLDAIGLDFKAPPSYFTTNTTRSTELYTQFYQTLTLLIQHPEIALEVRTTVHTDLLPESAINEIITILEQAGYHGTYYLQPFIFNQGKTILQPEINHHPRPLDMNLIRQPQTFQVVYRH